MSRPASIVAQQRLSAKRHMAVLPVLLSISEKRRGLYKDHCHCRRNIYQSQIHDYKLGAAHLTAAFNPLENLQAVTFCGLALMSWPIYVSP